jgi:hypothetical protein
MCTTYRINIWAKVILILLFIQCDKEPTIPNSDPIPIPHTITIHENERVASFTLAADEFDRLGKLSREEYNELYKIIYSTFKDDFDFILELHNNTFSSSSSSGYTLHISNSIDGIGLPKYNNAGEMGSEGKLKAVIIIPSINGIKNGPLYHEIAHVWGNYLIDSEDIFNGLIVTGKPHWGFATCGGQLGGYSKAQLLTETGVTPKKYFMKPAEVAIYSAFEQYLMGIRPLQEVPSFDVLKQITSWDATSSTLFADSLITYTPDKIEEEFGIRSPGYSESQKEFKMLILVFTKKDLSKEEFAEIDRQADNFSKLSDNGDPTVNFWECTEGRAQISVGNLRASIK